MCGSDIFLGLIAIVFPPFAVWVKRGICSADSLINIALCCLGFVPGLIHAWYIISVTPDPTYEQLTADPERQPRGGSVTYYYVQQGGRSQRGAGQPRAYGTVNSSAPQHAFPGHDQGFVQPLPQQQQDATQAGGSTETPPSYAQAVTGDNKVQRA